MKKKHSFAASAAAVATAVAALSSCTTRLDEFQPIDGGPRMVSVTAGAPGTGTKVTMDGQYRFFWEPEGEQLAVAVSCMQAGTCAFMDLGGKYVTFTGTDYLLSENAKEATFSFPEPAYPQGGSGFVHQFVSPAGGASFKGGPADGRLEVSFPYSQHPHDNAPAPEAIQLHAVHTGTSAPMDAISTTFSHLNAFGKITLKNLRLPEGETVRDISIDLPGEQCEGWAFSPEGTCSDGETHSGRSIRLLLDKIDTTGISGSKGVDLWFGIMPQTISKEDGFKVVVETGSGAIGKTIRPAEGVCFEAGKAAGFSIDMEGPAAAYGFTLTVSDPAEGLASEGIDRSCALAYRISGMHGVTDVHVMAAVTNDYENDPGSCRSELEQAGHALSASQIQAINNGGLNDICTGLLPNTDYTLLVMARSGNGKAMRTATYSTAYLEHEWKAVGAGSITDDFIGPLNGKGMQNWSVHVDESTRYPGLYRLFEPFGEDCPYYSTGSYDTSRKWYMLIDATDPDHVVVRRQAVGYCDGTRGMAELYSLPDCFAKLQEGVIRFPVGSMLLKFNGASATVLATALTDSDGDGWSDGCITLKSNGGSSSSGGKEEEEEL